MKRISVTLIVRVVLSFQKKQEEDEDRRVKLVTCKQCFLVLSPDKNNQTGERHKLDQNI